MMTERIDGVIHTGYYSEEAVRCFQLILRVANPLYIKRTDLAMYNDGRIIRAPDGELLLHYDTGLRQFIEDYYKTIFTRFKNRPSRFAPETREESRVYDSCIQLCNAELEGKRLERLVGEPLTDQFKVSALDILYRDCLKTMEDMHDSLGIERLENLMSQVREIFYLKTKGEKKDD